MNNPLKRVSWGLDESESEKGEDEEKEVASSCHFLFVALTLKSNDW